MNNKYLRNINKSKIYELKFSKIFISVHLSFN